MNIIIHKFKDWQLCRAYWPNSEPMEIGAGAISIRTSPGVNQWSIDLETESLVVLCLNGVRVLYEKIQ